MVSEMVCLTVCVTTYNRCEILHECLKSIERQTFKDFELIIVDDGSTDCTKDVVEFFSNKFDNMKFICQENKGLTVARNKAIEMASGKYFTFIDDDDCWDEMYLEVMFNAIKGTEDVICICGSYSDTHSSYYDPFEMTLKDAFIQGFTPPVASQMYSVEMLRKVSGYNPIVKSGVDHDLWIRLLQNDKVKLKAISDTLVIPNTNDDIVRMTNSIEDRKKKISDSLVIWKGDLIDSFGDEFYKHFAKSYNYHIYSRVIISTLRKRNIFLCINSRGREQYFF